MLLTGCHRSKYDAAELAKTRPALQKVCDMAGGCEHVQIECHMYVGGKNDVFSGDTFWEVLAMGAYGISVVSLNDPNDQPLERAAQDWLESKVFVPATKLDCDERCKP